MPNYKWRDWMACAAINHIFCIVVALLKCAKKIFSFKQWTHHPVCIVSRFKCFESEVLKVKCIYVYI